MTPEFERAFDQVFRCDEECPKCSRWRVRKVTPHGGASSVWKCEAPGCSYVSLVAPRS